MRSQKCRVNYGLLSKAAKAGVISDTLVASTENGRWSREAPRVHLVARWGSIRLAAYKSCAIKQAYSGRWRSFGLAETDLEAQARVAAFRDQLAELGWVRATRLSLSFVFWKRSQCR